MTRMWPPGGARRPLAPRVAVPREPVDPARIGRRAVRRRAKGMGATALENARFDARQASRHEDLADELRRPAELATDQLLAAMPPDTVYDPDADDVVQAELAADAREAELRELGTLEQTEPRDEDEAARDELTRRARLRPGRRRRLARTRSRRPVPGVSDRWAR